MNATIVSFDLGDEDCHKVIWEVRSDGNYITSFQSYESAARFCNDNGYTIASWLMRKIRKCDYLELAVWLAHYHSGQWSRGYRILCKLKANWSSNFEREAEQSEIYQYLSVTYAGKV